MHLSRDYDDPDSSGQSREEEARKRPYRAEMRELDALGKQRSIETFKKTIAHLPEEKQAELIKVKETELFKFYEGMQL